MKDKIIPIITIIAVMFVIILSAGAMNFGVTNGESIYTVVGASALVVGIVAAIYVWKRTKRVRKENE